MEPAVPSEAPGGPPALPPDQELAGTPVTPAEYQASTRAAAPEELLSAPLRAMSRRALLTIGAAIVVVWVVLMAFDAVRPFIVGVVLVYLLAPFVDRLSGIGVPRALAVLLSFVVVIAVVTVIAMVSLTPLIRQLQAFIADLPTIARDARPAVEDFYVGLRLSPDVRAYIDRLIASAAAGARSIDLGAIVAPIVGSVFGILGTITAYAILPAWLFFLLKDRSRLADRLERSLPADWRGDVFAVFAMVERVFGNWIRGQLLLGASVGVASFLGLELLSIWINPVFGRYAVLLALVAGILELVPIIGPIISAVPAVLIGLTAGPTGFVAALILYLLIQQLENNVLVPKIQGDAVELHPSAVMLALVVGAALAGILGAIVSLPITAAARDIFRYLFRRLSEPPSSVREALSSISPKLLRSVRASALTSDVAQ
jgi:predicted PurR-regulated permease PerM